MLIKEQVTRPFQNIGPADIFKFNCQQFLLVADQFSRMPFIQTMKTVTSANCIEYFKVIFAVHGIPERLYTYNARYFVSNEFHNFTTKWEFTHITSTPRYAQSNGFIECIVQTAKKTLQKNKNKDRLSNSSVKPKNSTIWQPFAVTGRNHVRQKNKDKNSVVKGNFVFWFGAQI